MGIKRLKKTTKRRNRQSRFPIKKSVSNCSRTVEIPDGITVEKSGSDIVVKGPKGELTKNMKNSQLKVDIADSKITFSADSERRKVKAVLGTLEATTKNMIEGVTKGWECHVKVVHSHFPPKVNVKDGRVVIQNFLGEKESRSAKILPGTSVKVDKDLIIITGIDKEVVGQVGANIEKSVKITGFDRRVFQDGCYIVKKPGE